MDKLDSVLASWPLPVRSGFDAFLSGLGGKFQGFRALKTWGKGRWGIGKSAAI